MTDAVSTVGVSQAKTFEAYERAAERISAVQDGDDKVINADIIYAFTVIMGSLPEIREYRAQIDAMRPDLVQDFDNLETYAQALLHIDADWNTTKNPPSVVPALVKEATALREDFVTHVKALATRNLVDGSVLQNLRGAVGHKNVAGDLRDLARLLRRNWENVSARTVIQLEELVRAEDLSLEILTAIGVKEQAPARQNALALERRRAFCLVTSTYEVMRRALLWICGSEKERDKVAPSFYKHDNSSKRVTDHNDVSAPAAEASDSATAGVASGADVYGPGGSPFVDE